MVIDDSIIPEKKNTSTKPQFGLKIKGFYLVFLWQMHDLTCLLKIAVTQADQSGSSLWLPNPPKNSSSHTRTSRTPNGGTTVGWTKSLLNGKELYKLPKITMRSGVQLSQQLLSLHSSSVMTLSWQFSIIIMSKSIYIVYIYIYVCVYIYNYLYM